MRKIHVKDAFRQVPVDPAGAPVFGYVVNDLVVVDFRLQFGWRSSPGLGGLMASALEDSHNHTTFRGARISRAEKNAVAHVQVAGHRPEIVVPIPFDCAKLSGKGGGPGDTFFVRYYDTWMTDSLWKFQELRRVWDEWPPLRNISNG